HTPDGEGGSLAFCGFPVEQLQAALGKLTQKYSVKLSDENGVREFPYAVPSVSERARHERDSVTRTANDNATDNVSKTDAPATETENNAPKFQETSEQRKDAGKNRETAVFEYQGYRFEPAGVLPQEDDFSAISKKISSDREMGVSTYDWAKRPWSHDAFYQASGGVTADVFRCLETGKLYIPGENELFEYLGEYQPYPRQEQSAKKDSQPERNVSAPKESVAEEKPVTEIAHTTGEKNPYPEISGDVPGQGRRVVTMEDADAALRLWNANLASKVEAMRYILAHGQEPDAAAWLAREYGDMDATPRIFTFPGAERDLILTWDEIKVRLSELIREGAFITPEEMDILNPDRLTGLKFQDALVKAMTERPYTESVTRGGLRYAVGGKIGAELNVSGGVMKASLVIKDITDASVVYALTDAPTVRRVRMERGRFEKLLDSGRFYLREQPQRDEKSQTAPAKKGQGRSRPESNYRTFAKLFPEIASGEYRYLRMKVNGDGETGYMPLNVEWIDNDEIALSHTYTQNGDLMYDPEMTFRVDRDAGTLEALTFRQDNAGLYQEVYQSPTVWSPRLRSDLNNFARTWLKNISDAPYVKDYAITERNGNDIRIDFDNKGNPILETPQEEASPEQEQTPEQEAAAQESVQEMESSAPE
ncbi:MAG: hypothetical protein J6X53_06595, partial [Abditibacteriota bacterium]|nr:hypothetical protein [Abditibacteriota bacterium]